MKKAVVFYNEKDFREWFESNLDFFDVKRIILSQEPCPDYILEMKDGRVLKVEAELIDINFKYHKHDPAKVDLIIACYASNKEILGVPVKAVNKLRMFDFEPREKLSPEGPLSEDEIQMLQMILSSSTLSLLAIGRGIFAGNETIYLHASKELVEFLKGKRLGDSIFNIITSSAREYIRKYHHMLVASGWSERACNTFESLMKRELIRVRPISFMEAAYDGFVLNHEGWMPSEAFPTGNVKKYHKYIYDDLWKTMFGGPTEK